MERVELREALEHKILKLKTLSEMNQELKAVDSVEEIFPVIMRSLFRSWPFEKGYGFFEEAERPGYFRCWWSQGSRPKDVNEVGTIWEGDRRSLMALCLRKREVVSLGGKENSDWLEFKRGWIQTQGVAVPLPGRKGIVGILLLGLPDSGYLIGPRESADLMTYASHAAQSLEMVDRMARLRSHSVAVEYLNAELERTIEKLKRADRIKNRFVSIVSHELRTPLTCVSSYTETILSSLGDLDEETMRHFLGVIQEEAARLTRLINEILDVSRLDSGEIFLDVTDVNLVQSIERTVETLGPIARDKNIRLEFAKPASEENFVIEGDHGKIAQILTNVAYNGIKYTPAGGSVTLETEAFETNVVIRVADTGLGIPPEETERIFEEFHKVDRPGSENEDGTGLGLAITKRYIELHAGSIAVESEVGRGSVFTLTFPRVLPPERFLGGPPLTDD